MLRRACFIFLLIFLPLGCAHFEESGSVKPANRLKELEPFSSDDRVLVMAPHPDDETIGCAGIIQEALSKKAKVKVLYLTNGDHNEIAFLVYEKRPVLTAGEFIRMGELRRQEAIKAMKLLGLAKEELIFLGYPDFGTLAIFNRYWRVERPFSSWLTHIWKVPYKDNFTFGAEYNAENILNDIKNVLLSYKPNKIFVSHPADTNPDHVSFYLFLQVALRDLNKELSSPKVYPYLIHCAGWPLPRHYHPQLALTPPKKFSESQLFWRTMALSGRQVDKKYQAILSYRSQTQSSAFYLLSFARKNELFSDYPLVEMKKQVSPKECAVSFFGFSPMFADIGELNSIEHPVEDKGYVSYAIADNYFMLRLEKTRDMNRRFAFSVYIFGYSSKAPFEFMPKIHILARHKKFMVFERGKEISPQGVIFSYSANLLTLKVPLSLLGDPDFILTSIKSFGEKIPYHTSGFRRVEIK